MVALGTGMTKRLLPLFSLLALVSSCTLEDTSANCSSAFIADFNAMNSTYADSSVSSRQQLEGARSQANLFKLLYGDQVCRARVNGSSAFIDAEFEADKIITSVELFIAALDAREVAPTPSSSGGTVVSSSGNPIVSSSSQGGQISGLVEDSVSGRALEDAHVGFKQERTASQYFFETRTNANGRYQSPFLLPGEYFVDITHPNYIATGASAVRVEVGSTAEANVSASQPIGDAAYRFTVSWCDNCEGGVRDVDSYLRTPTGAHIYYSNPRPSGEGADLDRDDTDWTGPETVTISELNTNGEYVYYVDNFNARNDAQALGRSGIRILVYSGTSNRVLDETVVPAGIGLRYEAYRIVNGQLHKTGQFIPEGSGTSPF